MFLSRLTGLPVVAAERCAMGFENRTYRATLADKQAVIIQMITNRGMAAHKIRLAQALPERLAEVGLRAPRMLHANANTEPPFMVREFFEGEMGAVLLRDDAGAIRLAEAMGALLPVLTQVDHQGLGLHTGWANPARLAAQAHSQLQRRRGLLDSAQGAVLEHIIGQVEALFAGRPGVFAHGDFCPVNVIIAPPDNTQRTTNNKQLTIIDTEFARIADPLFDAAWWGWVVRYHHPERWAAAFPRLLAAAGIDDDQTTRTRIAAIQRLRLLEALDYNAALSADRGAAWAARLVAMLEWDS